MVKIILFYYYIMDNKNEENENCITNIENLLSPHIGKFGMGLSVIGGAVSVLLSFKIVLPASIIMGLLNVGIFAGGLAFERIEQQNKRLNDDCESQKQMIRRLTIAPKLHDSDTPETNENTSTPQTNNSNESIEPINFESMHENNKKQTAMNNYNFPDN